MKIAITSTGEAVALHDNGTWKVLKFKGSGLEKLRNVEQNRGAVEFLGKLFKQIGVRVIDSNEAFTCINRDHRIDFKEGIEQNEVDFCLNVHGYQIDRFINELNSGFQNPTARFRILREIFRASIGGEKSFLNNNITTNVAFRKLIGSKDLLHLYILSPDKTFEQDATFTLFFVNGKWNLAEGLAGDPDRIFRISADDAIELQSRAKQFMHDVSLMDIPKIAQWYKDWRGRVEAAA